MDWFEPVRAYCERADAGYWAEPFNALSNTAFLIAAAAAAHRATRTTPPDRAGLALAGLIVVVGVGSFLFHTLAVYWSMLADVIPIALFIDAYFALALRRYLRFSPATVAATTVGFAISGFLLTPSLDGLTGLETAEATNGSIDYLPALLALFGMSAATICQPETRITGTGQRLAAIGGLFLISPTARTLDRAACAVVPIGTHPLWHILNAAVLYALVATAIRHRETAG